MKKNIYFFQWVSDLGGADTRLKELIQLFSETKCYNLFAIPNDDGRLNEKENIDFLKNNNVHVLSWSELPEKTSGFAISFCNFRLFSEPWRINKIKSMGLKFIWSNDMMWTINEETEAINKNQIDVLLFTSDFHRLILQQKNNTFKNTKNFTIPNYFHFEKYQKIKKVKNKENKFIVGKLSRSDLMKYGENFPLFYSKMPIDNPKFRIMGWNENLSNKFKWFNFDKDKWELLNENQETPLDFLSKLDLYVFNSNHKYIENQTRSMIEAQLLGVPSLAPNYGNFPKMIWHGRNGFIYNSVEECYHYVNLLDKNKYLYNELSNNSKNLSRDIWTNKEHQLQLWDYLFNNL